MLKYFLTVFIVFINTFCVRYVYDFIINELIGTHLVNFVRASSAAHSLLPVCVNDL